MGPLLIINGLTVPGLYGLINGWLRLFHPYSWSYFGPLTYNWFSGAHLVHLPPPCNYRKCRAQKFRTKNTYRGDARLLRALVHQVDFESDVCVFFWNRRKHLCNNHSPTNRIANYMRYILIFQRSRFFWKNKKGTISTQQHTKGVDPSG